MDSGYSGTPLAKKLGLKRGTRLRLLNQPQGFLEAVEEWVRVEGRFNVAVAFCRSMEDVALAFETLEPMLDPPGGIWIAWPKKASGIPSDCSDMAVRDMGLSTGLVDNKVCAIDETWSALRFARRLETKK